VDGIAVLAVDARLPTDLRPLVAYTHPRDGTRNGRRPAARRASVVTPATGRVPSPPTRPQR
ncbi:hypothetical protein, partial [Sphingomonas bacterium]|uniref:hypothetical protein n=1 Tax=Sphingomonas bacterium TaxID=1895847 RepID=UPI0015755F34